MIKTGSGFQDITEDENYYSWWILGKDGELIAKFDWPGKKLQRHTEPRQIRAVDNEYLYTLEKDADTQLRKVTRYKIVFSDFKYE
ncbi:MAG: hypothetical protein U5J95_02710 [Balneolaceae bacterium]|nr:hypothetical protein [Balneolaceae bacterium]